MNDLVNILALATLGSFIALFGGFIFLSKKSWSGFLSSYSVPFAAGVLLTVALVGLLPEAIDYSGEAALTTTLIAFLVAYLFENFAFGLHHHEDDHHHSHVETSVPLIVIGDTIHNFIDGVVIAATYLVSPGLGLITAISTLLHEVPHEIGDFGLLLKAGWKRAKILKVNLFSASTTIIGALLVYYFNGFEQIIGSLLSVAAGLFLYLGASDFLPHIHEEGLSKNKAIFSLLLGVFIMLFTINVIPHAH